MAVYVSQLIVSWKAFVERDGTPYSTAGALSTTVGFIPVFNNYEEAAIFGPINHEFSNIDSFRVIPELPQTKTTRKPARKTTEKRWACLNEQSDTYTMSVIIPWTQIKPEPFRKLQCVISIGYSVGFLPVFDSKANAEQFASSLGELEGLEILPINIALKGQIECDEPIDDHCV